MTDWKPQIGSEVRFGAEFDGVVIGIEGDRCKVQFPGRVAALKAASLMPNYMPRPSAKLKRSSQTFDQAIPPHLFPKNQRTERR